MTVLLINLGAGRMPIAGYRSLDSQPYDGVDDVCRVPPLPYEDATVAHIYSGHFFEHLPPWDVEPLLAECWRVLIPGGTLTIVVPDADKARLLMESMLISVRQYALCVAGAREEDMPHQTLWNVARLHAAITRAGFLYDQFYRWQDDERVYDRRAIWQCGVRGVKV